MMVDYLAIGDFGQGYFFSFLKYKSDISQNGIKGRKNQRVKSVRLST